MAPRSFPEDAVARLHAEVNRILALPATQQAQARSGAQPMPMGVAEFGTYVEQDIIRQRDFIRMARISAQ